MKKAVYFLITILLLTMLIGCVEADPLEPEGPILEVDTSSLIFEEIFTFQNEVKKVVIENTGDTELIINDIVINNNDGEVYKWELNNLVLPKGAKDTLSITFQPLEFVRYNRDLIIKSNYEDDVLINLDGAGIPKVIDQSIWVFQTQSSIESFKDQLYDIVSNVKELKIIGLSGSKDAIVDLKPLSLFKEVELLEISDNVDLSNLEGLGNVKVTERLRVISNGKLETLNKLTGLESSKFHVELENNDNLRSLDFLEPLTLIGDLIVKNNSFLDNFDGAENIETIDGDLVIQDNRFLKSLDGLQNVLTAVTDEENPDNEDRIIDDVSIRNNRLLSDFCALDGLINNASVANPESLYGNIVIDNNDSNNITVESIKMGTCK